MAEQAGEPVGTVRFDREGASAEISVTVAPGHRGGGVGSKVIREVAELELAARPGLTDVVAEVQDGNERSLRAFERAGYVPAADGRREGSVVLTLDRAKLQASFH
jgi:RimJ/RimL family protein N-acetyltransferase